MPRQKPPIGVRTGVAVDVGLPQQAQSGVRVIRRPLAQYSESLAEAATSGPLGSSVAMSLRTKTSFEFAIMIFPSGKEFRSQSSVRGLRTQRQSSPLHSVVYTSPGTTSFFSLLRKNLCQRGRQCLSTSHFLYRIPLSTIARRYPL